MTRDRAADERYGHCVHRVVAADIVSAPLEDVTCVTASRVIKSSPSYPGLKNQGQRNVYRAYTRSFNNELDAPFCIRHTGYRMTNCRDTS